VSACLRLPQDVVHGVLAFRLRSQNQGLAEADILELLRLDAVTANMGDPILGPDELGDLHGHILHGCSRRLPNTQIVEPAREAVGLADFDHDPL